MHFSAELTLPPGAAAAAAEHRRVSRLRTSDSESSSTSSTTSKGGTLSSRRQSDRHKGSSGGGGVGKDSPARSGSSTPPPPSMSDESRTWKKQGAQLINDMSRHKFSNTFALAPSSTEYTDVVRRPVDLASIRRGIIDAGTIHDVEELEREVALMFLNATMFNHSGSEVRKNSFWSSWLMCALVFYKYFEVTYCLIYGSLLGYIKLKMYCKRGCQVLQN